MVARQITARGVRDPKVLAVMGQVKRHLFVPKAYRYSAYADGPLPIGHGQTISQPYIVAAMTEALELKGHEKVLEIGTGSGYQSAVLARLAKKVYTIEIVGPLCQSARGRLARLGYKNVRVRCGDGYQGWPQEAPFEAIILTCAPPKLPGALVRQLKPGGRLVAPVGPVFGIQRLILVTKDATGAVSRKTLMMVRFVPMVRGRR
ncbi:MAG: protein-L-isoaspartate(D-aspartate) O-methyltransferase [Proteobacteria bacterium]|nr:protein-L-isoaspartate(D-aspartate) O-methyltransferase [Pseudomonadota bacterium]MBU1740824.1 protein-L-isoaspartate(D-aspartate) O-methyltransferase [Pseudomonadota bacterium]